MNTEDIPSVTRKLWQEIRMSVVFSFFQEKSKMNGVSLEFFLDISTPIHNQELKMRHYLRTVNVFTIFPS
jgi:hypothetical protein